MRHQILEKKRTFVIKNYSLLLNLTQLIIYFRFFLCGMYPYINIAHIQNIIEILLSREKERERERKRKKIRAKHIDAPGHKIMEK